MKNEITEMLLNGTALSNCNTRQEVVKLVNASDTPENVAAAYAIGAAEEAGFGYALDNIEAHLDYLDDAEFDFRKAAALALEYAPLTTYEMDEYVEMQTAEMNDDDKADFIADPESWRDGIETNHVIVCREGIEIYCDDWDTLRDKILARLL